MLEKRVCDQKESEYERKKDGVLERKYNDGRSKDMGRRKNTEMKYVETLKKTVLIFGCALFVNILFWSGQRMLLQRGIAEEVLRFHVLANSDSAADQAVKLEVRDAVLAWLEEAQVERSVTQGKKETANTGTETDSSFMSDLESEKNTKEKEEEFLRAHLTELEAVANNVLASKGQSYQAHAELTTCYFPERTYGACTFPSGWYEAFRIKLGKAKGHNWWCVLYPRLCFTDSLHAVVKEEEMQQLSDVLTEAEYDSLLHEPSRWKFTFRWF